MTNEFKHIKYVKIHEIKMIFKTYLSPLEISRALTFTALKIDKYKNNQALIWLCCINYISG